MCRYKLHRANVISLRSPTAIGLGLRIPHYQHIFSEWPDVEFFEIISENFMGTAELPRKNLQKILNRYPVVLHGVGLGIASAGPLNFEYLKKLKDLADLCDAPYVTDHLCWTVAEGINHHDLLPFPYTEENANFIADRAAQVQDFLQRPFGLENLSSYVSFKNSVMSEWGFYNQVIEKSGCHYMLDINNIFVSGVNHGFNPKDYLASIHWSKVLQCHIAGHSVREDGSLLDTHDAPVREEVWELFTEAWQLSGGFRTLLERDAKIPDFSEVFAEAQLSKMYRGEEVKIAR